MIIKSLQLSAFGGIQTHVWELSRALLDQGARVHIVTGGNFRRGTRTFELEGRTVTELATPPAYRLPFFRDLVDEAQFNLRLLRWLDRHHEQFDVLHLHGRSGNWIPWRRRAWSGKCVWTAHGLTQMEWMHNGRPLQTWLHCRFNHWLEQQLVRQVPALIAVSQDIRRQMIDQLAAPEANIQVVPNGILPQSPGPEPQELLIGFVGRMVPLKGVRLLPRLLQRLDPAVRLVMIGKGPELPQLQREFARRGLTDRVIWTGQLPHEAVMDWMRRLQVLVVPSLYEPQGRVVLEAMRLGRPVVASRVGGLTEMIRSGENGYLFMPGDSDDLYEKVRFLLQHPRQARHLGAQGQKTVQAHYAWPQLARNTLRVYQQAEAAVTLMSVPNVATS